ncbi:MAG: DUF2971 domain-containing protein [Bacilli bacterium]|nr:DUF2971 domain-containing protein [Bacilli bacterium]
MDNRKEYLNKIIDNSNKNVERPKILYKYRGFDEHTFKMLENKEIFLCAAEKLDDPSECIVSINNEGYYDLMNGTLRRQCVEEILKMIKPYTTDNNFECIRNAIYRIMGSNLRIRNNFLIDFASELQDMCPGKNIAPFINWLASIPKVFDDSKYKPKIDELLITAIKARKETGICSLAESSDISNMWINYADNNSGYCIEYDLNDFDYNNLIFPVIYEDNKETNLITQVVASILGKFIYELSFGEINADRTQYLKLFLTKDTKWEYQKEWRVIGRANEKLKAPNVRRIIVGSKVSDDNFTKMKEFCCKNNIKIEKKKL